MSGKLDDIITNEVIMITSMGNTNNLSHTVYANTEYATANIYDSSMYSSMNNNAFIGDTNNTINVPGNTYIRYKYAEDKIVADFSKYLKNTYAEHYKTDSSDHTSIECFDAWIALGDSMPTFRNTAIKYLWRYGKKNGSNKKDLLKALHYTLMCLYVDHYKKGE